MLRGLVAGVIGAVVAAVVALSGAGPFFESPSQLTSHMTGPWAGTAQINVSWTAARTLPVRLTISPDGGVTGTIGDAALRDGRFEANRGAIGRALHVKTDWIVRGKLEGDLIKAERIRRDGVMVPLNFAAGRFEGGVNTTGSHFGGKESMWLAAHGLVLDRAKVGR